jgi:cytochrome b6-f complex iron-sulfur subunit
MNRRKFIGSVFAAVAGSAIVGSIGELGRSSVAKARSVASTLTGAPTLTGASVLTGKDVREVPIELTDTPELVPVGGTYHLEYEDLQRDILVAHVTPGQFVGVDLKCTHRGCDIDYHPDDKKFVCPCHGSEYDLYGRVLKGPSQRPLNCYHAEQKGNEVIVTVYGAGDPPPANSIPPADTVKAEVADTSFAPKVAPDSLKVPKDSN